MIKQDNRTFQSTQGLDDKMRLLQDLLNDDCQENATHAGKVDVSPVPETPQGDTVTVSGNGNIVSTGNGKVVLVGLSPKNTSWKACLLAFLFF